MCIHEGLFTSINMKNPPVVLIASVKAVQASDISLKHVFEKRYWTVCVIVSIPGDTYCINFAIGCRCVNNISLSNRPSESEYMIYFKYSRMIRFISPSTRKYFKESRRHSVNEPFGNVGLA